MPVSDSELQFLKHEPPYIVCASLANSKSDASFYRPPTFSRTWVRDMLKAAVRCRHWTSNKVPKRLLTVIGKWTACQLHTWLQVLGCSSVVGLCETPYRSCTFVPSWWRVGWRIQTFTHSHNRLIPKRACSDDSRTWHPVCYTHAAWTGHLSCFVSGWC